MAKTDNLKIRIAPETIAAIAEAQALKKDPNAKAYATPKELFDELKAELAAEERQDKLPY